MPLPHVYGLYPGGPCRGIRARPQAGRTDIDKGMSSGLYLYCTELCAVCIRSHSVRSLPEIKISAVLQCCGSLCTCRFLRISQSQYNLTRYKIIRFKSHDTVSLFLHALPKHCIPTYLEQCGNTLFGALRKAFHISQPISHNKIVNLVQSHVTGVHSMSNCQGWDSFNLTLYNASLSFCQHWIIHTQILSRPCLCFLGDAGSRGPQWPRQHPPFPPLRLSHGGAGFGGCAARASPPSSSLRPRTSSFPLHPPTFYDREGSEEVSRDERARPRRMLFQFPR